MSKTNILIKAFQLIRGPFGEIDDYWSKLQKQKFKQILVQPWQVAQSNPEILKMDQRIQDVKSQSFKDYKTKYQTAVDNVLKEDTDIKPNSLDIFLNGMPYGFHNNENEKIIGLTGKEEELNFRGYKYLFQNLFPNEYQDLDDAESGRETALKYAYGSLLDWPSINPRSIGLGSLSVFTELFKNHYLDVQNSIIVKQDFFDEFTNKSGMFFLFKDANNRDTRSPQNMKEDLDNFFVLKHSNWWKNPDNNNFGAIDPNLENNFDSYGFFFMKRGLYVATSPSYSDYDNYKITQNDNLGSIDLLKVDSQYIYNVNDNNKFHKPSLCLFRQYYDQNLNNFADNIEYDDINKGLDTYLMKIFYNFSDSFTTGSGLLFKSQPNIIQQNIQGIDLSKGTKRVPGPNTILYNDAAATDSLKNQNVVSNLVLAGGKRKKNKKKMRGGDINDLITPPGPALNVQRFNMKYDTNNFANILKQYKTEITVMNPNNFKNLYNKITGITSIPIFYHGVTDSRNVGVNLTFEDLRIILLICNVFSTQYKLLAHFLNNLIACYVHCKTKLVELHDVLQGLVSSNELSNYGNLPQTVEYDEYFSKMERGFDTLINTLRTIRDKLLKITTDLDNTSAGTDKKSLFLGLLTTALGKDDAEFQKILTKNVFLDVDVNNKIILKEDVFGGFIRTLSLLDATDQKVNLTNATSGINALGGIPFISVDPQINAKAWATFWFSIYWREKSNDYLYKNLEAFLEDKATEVKQDDVDKAYAILDKKYPAAYLQQIIFSVQGQGRLQNIIKNILNYFYQRSLVFAKYILQQYGLLADELAKKSGKKSLKNILAAKLASSSFFKFSQYKKNIYQSMNLFALEIDYMIYKLQTVYFPTGTTFSQNEQLEREAQFRWIAAKLRNLSFRLIFLNRAMADGKNRNSYLQKAGFTMEEITSGQIINSPQNKMGLLKYNWIDADYVDRIWWNQIYYRFNNFKNDSNISPINVKKLFVFAVDDKFFTNVYLIDVFGCALREREAGESMVKENIRIINAGGGKNVWAEDNTIIKLTGLIKTGLNEVTELINGKYLGNSPVFDYITQTSTLLKLNPLFLQGKDDYELQMIINDHIPLLRRTQGAPLGSQPNNEIKVYKVNKDILEDQLKLRKWCYDLLFSLPVDFSSTKSDFDDIQVNLGNIIKFGKDKYSLVVQYLLPLINKVSQSQVAVLQGLRQRSVPMQLSKTQSILIKLGYGNLISQYGVQNMDLLDVGKEEVIIQ